MKIENDLVLTLFGQALEYEESDVIHFEDGILGFDSLKKYLLLTMDVDNSTFYFLQSVEDMDVSFTVANPFLFVEGYEFEAGDEDMKKLGIDSVEKLMVLCIVNIKSDIKQTTMNLKAPILLNVENKKASQIIVDEDYEISHKFLNK